jgi:hypothetical protein
MIASHLWGFFMAALRLRALSSHIPAVRYISPCCPEPWAIVLPGGEDTAALRAKHTHKAPLTP